jgi:RES domain-containing protein
MAFSLNMLVYRLTRRKYQRSLDGVGAAKASGRWNSKGTNVLYTAESRALALCEVCVHLSLHKLPPDYVMIEIELSNDLAVTDVNMEDLPEDWHCYPPNELTQGRGDAFIESDQFDLLRVPSAIVPGDFNLLINPERCSGKIKIIELSDFPLRLFRTL